MLRRSRSHIAKNVYHRSVHADIMLLNRDIRDWPMFASISAPPDVTKKPVLQPPCQVSNMSFGKWSTNSTKCLQTATMLTAGAASIEDCKSMSAHLRRGAKTKAGLPTDQISRALVRITSETNANPTSEGRKLEQFLWSEKEYMIVRDSTCRSAWVPRKPVV